MIFPIIDRDRDTCLFSLKMIFPIIDRDRDTCLFVIFNSLIFSYLSLQISVKGRFDGNIGESVSINTHMEPVRLKQG